MRRFLLLVGLVLLPARLDAAETVDYLRDIKPVLKQRCFACHGSLKQKAKLRLDAAALLRKGGRHGPAIEPGNAKGSLLIERLSDPEESTRMPPQGKPLTEKQIALLKAWIEKGAPAPPGEKPEEDPRAHWAFQKPVRPALPIGANGGNAIDAFLTAARARQGVTASRPTDRPTLLRRVYLDLIGLPPSREQLHAFLADTAPDAYEKVVERLLASPQYGERWGRHWMDIWRYSDWWGLGAEVRNSQKHIWHWRDWILSSLNADKGYDQMLREMLAADELYPNDLDRLRATGFLARQYFKFNRNSWLEETVEHTSKAFLGLTMNCAKCHDHKFDPISQIDYYRFRAFFEPYQVRTDEVPGETDFEKDGIPRAFDCNLDASTYRFVRGDEKQPMKNRPLTPGLPRLLSFGSLDIHSVALPPEAHAPGLRSFVLVDHLRAAEKQIEAARNALAQARKTLAEAERLASKAAPTSGTKQAIASGKGEVLLSDRFAGPRPEAWETGPGNWKHEGGKLLQQLEGETRSVLRMRRMPPTDFQARFKFAITGGEPWRSVGICFDTEGDNEVLVYASAYAAGPKVQIAYKQGGNYIYPSGAMQARSIKLNEPIELTVRVRGPLLNVAINGEHVLAYRLPLVRRAGSLQLITFAAKAEFLAFELSTLPAATRLVDAGAPPAPAPKRPLTVEQARAAVVLAEKTLAAAQAQPIALRACAAADRARYHSPPESNARELAQHAARADRTAALARAEVTLARAEIDLLQADPTKKSETEKKRKAAHDAVIAARKALDSPGETYTSLRGSLKTLESNMESEASRSRPFPTTSTGRRSALAHWLTDRRHPLTARVAVNHVWARHFGSPLVATVFDFGRKGAAPTHPQLLDWLAIEFMENGWSLKRLHRLLVTSDAYRLTSSSAGSDPATRTSDPQNRFCWRMNPIRMEAQVVRDSLLHLAGDLDPTMGGPPLDPVRDEASRRRSLYFVHSHNDHHRFLAMFDDASVLECYRRADSIVPQQALALSNSRLALAMAGRINGRLHEGLGSGSDRDFVRAAFETVLCGEPTAAEQQECEQTLARLTALLKKQGRMDAVRRARGHLIQALVNHNDFITIR